MDTRTVEQVNQWESRPFSGGLADLRELAEGGFSGAVRAAGTWAFVLNGRVVGVFEGEIEDLEDRDGTAFRAPDRALVLLFAMQEQGGQTQAKYYTNDTPLSEVHETLSSASFSGYVELSENVLSGDYYVVYYGGRSMSTAFVGESGRLLTGEEAFERADDEVGIYEVRKVDLDVIDLSEVVDEPEGDPGPAAGAVPDGSRAPTDDAEGPDPDPETAEPEAPGPETTESEIAEADQREPASPEPADGEPRTPDADEDAGPASGTEPAPSPDRGSEPATAGSSSPAQGDDVFDEEQQWRQARAIPSLDPGRSADDDGAGAAAQRRAKSARAGRSAGRSESGGAEAESRQSKESAEGATIEEFKRALAESKREIERLSERLSKTETEQQELLAQREELRSEVERLESELRSARAGDDAAASSPAGRSLPAGEALEGTNLFVRYASKSQPTLGDARDGADREEVNANLSLEYHTQFDADEVVVDGRAFDEFLRGSIRYRFVEWLIEELVYEIRDTGHVNQLRDLYDAIPKIDRAELAGNATIRKIEDGEEVRTQRTFDVILRDRMGNPLVVANLNDARDPATGDMMADLVSAASDVGETSASLSAAVLVTASFFEPAALETASEATGGGLLSREKKESYVKLSRKRGYHLCLVETRGGQFHVNVPEL